MSTHAAPTFRVKTWDEQAFSEVVDGPKLTRVSVTKSFRGDVEGEGTLEYLMVYHANGSASLNGLERVVGRIGGPIGQLRAATCRHFEAGVAKATGSWYRARAPEICRASEARAGSRPPMRISTP
ncbi:MAG: DUF3224 family protein [Gemmatimonadales bacterium]|nr:DUF3224 family protein [Gemmatimonadales bacterium]